MADRDFSQVDSMLLRREEDKYERLKQKAAAAEENMRESIAGLLKQIEVKKQLAPGVLRAMEDEQGEQLRRLEAKGTGGREGNWGSKDREVPTGIDGGTTRVDAWTAIDYQS